MSVKTEQKNPGKQLFRLVRPGIVTFSYDPPPAQSAAEFRKSFNAEFLTATSSWTKVDRTPEKS